MPDEQFAEQSWTVPSYYLAGFGDFIISYYLSFRILSSMMFENVWIFIGTVWNVWHFITFCVTCRKVWLSMSVETLNRCKTSRQGAGKASPDCGHTLLSGRQSTSTTRSSTEAGFNPTALYLLKHLFPQYNQYTTNLHFSFTKILKKRCAMCWNEEKKTIFQFYFSNYHENSLKIFRTKIIITRKIKSVKSEIGFFFWFSWFRIFHVNLTTFEKKTYNFLDFDLGCFQHKKKISKVVKFTWNNQNRLDKKKNQVSDFSDF